MPIGGAIFVFSAKIDLEGAKNVFLHTLQANGGIVASAPPGYATDFTFVEMASNHSKIKSM